MDERRMTADVELLPLPEELKGRGKSGAIKDYSRANIAHATAAKDAEVEALRAEVDSVTAEAFEWRDRFTDEKARAERLQAELDNRWATGVHSCHDKCQRIACVLRRDNKRLAEALRFARTRFAQYMDDADRAAFDAALHPTAAQENDHA